MTHYRIPKNEQLDMWEQYCNLSGSEGAKAGPAKTPQSGKSGKSGHSGNDVSFEDCVEFVTECLENQDSCNAWEIEFLHSIAIRLDSGRELTPKQLAALQKIHDKI